MNASGRGGRSPKRTGLTLVEVLLSMAIVAMVFAALTQLQDSGSRAALRATLTAEASILCQSELDAWLAGSRSSVRLDISEPIETAPEWSRVFQLQKLPASVGQGLSLLTVRVQRGRQAQSQFAISRWIPTPEKDGQL